MKLISLKTTCTLILLLFATTGIQAQMQKEDIALDYIYIGSGNAGNEGNYSKIAFSKFVAKGTLYRKVTKNRSMFFHTASYANMNIDYSKALDVPTELEQFHSFSYSIGASIPLKNKWRLTAVFSPTIASNFEGNVQFKDMQFLGIAFFGKPINKTRSLFLNIGAMYSNTFGSPAPLPYFNLVWNANKKFKFELGFPNTGVTYKASEKLSFGSRLFIAGDNLRLGDNLVYKDKTTPIDNIRLSNFGWGLNVKKRFNKHISLKFAGGYTFSRKFEFNDGSKVLEDFNLDNNFYSNIGLSISF